MPEALDVLASSRRGLTAVEAGERLVVHGRNELAHLPLSFTDWALIIALGSLVLVADEIRKAVLHRKDAVRSM